MSALATMGAVLLLLWALTGAGYAVMVYTPFTKIQFLDSQVVPAFATFAAWHGVFAWGALSGALLALWHGVARTTMVVVGIAGAAAALALSIWPVLPSLESDAGALVWAVVFLLPSLALSLWRLPRAAQGGDGQTPHAEALAAVLAAIVCGAAGVVVAISTVPVAEAGFRPVMALAAQLVLFGTVAAARVMVIALIPHRSTRSAVFRACGAAVTAWVVYAWLFRAINLTGADGVAVALLFGATIAAGVPVIRVPAIVALVLLTIVGIAAATVPGRIAPMDWNFLGQRLVIILAWCGAFFLARAVMARAAVPPRTMAGVFVLVLACALGLRAAQVTVDPARAGAWAAVDPSFAAVLDLAPLNRSEGAAELFRFLQEHTGLPRSTPVAPVDVTFTPALTPRPEPLPHIFMFVVDSLRQDYLGAYDASVTFTPAFDRLAADSLVFRRAFTRYGATGLSQPSMWVGGLMPHKQYIQPFAPMNALEKLIRANNYDVRMSYDIISRETVQPTTPALDLDAGVQNMDYRLCSTLTKLTDSLEHRTGRPIFAYTLPQDVHISTLTREGNAALDNGEYGNKFAPYASRVRRFDACFGAFIDALKARDLYNNSLIIVTSDHGDSLGEGGRWGHAYTVFPEILRVPLLIKLPQAMQGQWEAGVDEVAFTTDVAPTLYRLLGYDVQTDDRFFGVPLVSSPGQPRRRSPLQLGASSYGPVYAVFDHNGESLYVLDAVNYRDHLFRLGAKAADDREIRPSESQRVRYHQFIRTRLTELHEWYGVK